MTCMEDGPARKGAVMTVRCESASLCDHWPSFWLCLIANEFLHVQGSEYVEMKVLRCPL